MMMPANFSAVSENEMTYVVGGSVLDLLAPAMGAAQIQKFNTNMITLIGNQYLNNFLKGTVGAVFAGSWEPGDGLKILEANNVTGKKWYQVAINVIGNAAAIYNLGFGTVSNAVSGAKINASSSASAGDDADHPFYIKTTV